MTTVFPIALDNFANPTGTQSQAASRTHSQLHGDLNDAVEALQAKAGITNSTDVNSTDYKLRNTPFQQSGVASAMRTVQDKLYYLLDMLDYVPKASVANVLAGTADAAPYLSAAIDEAIARGAHGVRMPAGTLLLNSKISKTLTGFCGLALIGSGMGLTKLVNGLAAGDVLQIDCAAGDWWLSVSPSNALYFAHFSVLSGQLNLGTGLKINGGSLEGRPRAACVFDHVEFRAKDSINGQAFATALWLNDCGDCHLTGCRFFNGGTSNITGQVGVKISSTDATTDPTSFFFDSCEWYYGGKGIVCGDNPEGIHLSNCVMVKVDRGVEWICASESGLTVIGGHFNCLSYNFYLDGVYDVTISAVLSFLTGGSPQDHVFLQNGSHASITGNAFYQGTNGVNLGTLPAGARGVYVGGNQFSSMTNGVKLAAGSQNVTVGPNGYTSVTTRVNGAGGAGSSVYQRAYSVSVVPTLVGGAATEDVNVAIPVGVFINKPSVIIANSEASAQNIFCQPFQTSASTTATNAVIRLRKADGTSLAAGATRIHVVCYE